MSLTTSAHWMYASGGGFYDHEIDGSLRFADFGDNNGSNHYLSRTPSSSGSSTTWTWSAWVKRGANLGTPQHLFSQWEYPPNNQHRMFFGSDDRLTFMLYNGSSNSHLACKTPAAQLRDVSAWYHIVFVWDTTNGTADDRMRVYINGERQTTFASTGGAGQSGSINPSSSLAGYVNNTGLHTIGTFRDPSLYSAFENFDGYMADINFVDGTALDASSFGETKSGIWIPKAYSGSYGTNGFHLEFAGNTNDTSGNGNNWTTSGISSHDYMPDSPTNNFPTFPQLALKGAGHTQHLEGNLQLYQPSWGGWDLRIASGNMPASGKYYWEVYPAQGSFNAGYGGFVMAFDNIRGNENMSGFPTFGAPMAYFESGGLGDYRVNPGWVSYTRSGSFAWSTNSTVFQVAVDCDNNKVWFGINNSWMGVSGTTVTAGTGNPATGANGQAIAGDVTDYTFAINCADQQSAARAGVNFGQDSTFAGYKTAGGNSDANGYGDFQYAPPSGFLAMCSQNMPAPAIDPLDDATPEDHFNSVIWTGNSTNNRDIVTGHATDFVWIKGRSNATNHYLFDRLRGVNNQLLSNATSAQAIYSTDRMTAFNTDGFEVGAFTETNGSGRTFVGWSWMAGGTGVSNTDGSITSTVSANTDAGFSISKYTGTGSTMTWGHGLGVTPDLFIVKCISRADEWIVYPLNASGNLTNYLKLHSDVPYNSDSVLHTANSSVLGFGSSGARNNSGDDYICYAFAEKEGYSKFGKHKGNGSTDGPFVYTGFRPAFVIAKNTTSGAYDGWVVIDNKRDPYNVGYRRLYPNTSQAEDTGSSSIVDFTSNGFKIRTTSGRWNNNGQTYIYMAFAEQPFKYANAR